MAEVFSFGHVYYLDIWCCCVLSSGGVHGDYWSV